MTCSTAARIPHGLCKFRCDAVVAEPDVLVQRQVLVAQRAQPPDEVDRHAVVTRAHQLGDRKVESFGAHPFDDEAVTP